MENIEKEESVLALQFYPFSSLIDTSFWHVLTERKLELYKLDTKAIKVYASFRNEFPAENASYPLFGELIVYNTIEEFRSVNKKELLQKFGEKLWDNLLADDCLSQSAQHLSKFLLITFADLKKYHFHYWFAFPVFQCPQSSFLRPPQQISEVWSKQQINNFNAQLSGIKSLNKSYFITFLNAETKEITIHSLSEFEVLKPKNGVVYFSFADPCTNSRHPGWPLRNLLTLIFVKFRLESCLILSYRLQSNDCSESLLFDVKLTNASTNEGYPTCIGWEKNEKQKLSPKFVDLSSTFDPKRLAESAVDLNLKLMRWRLVPNLDLQKISSTKCLLLGSGTLGCNVARCLMVAWGVRNITFVDNGKVSYSNPVRQSLFEFEDCVGDGKPKAFAAADSMKRIFPCINSKGVLLTIPMPGHPISPNMINEVKKDVETLEELIASHDCVFLLMDTRESRWLPTVICQSKRKLVINAALGFDTYLVQRHGIRPLDTLEMSDKNRLGCYFCNDVVAPGDSTRNRTLDQQCTVTRPGVSMLAAGLAVELMVSVIQHPSGVYAEAAISGETAEDPFSESFLGTVPHQIRGFLSRFCQLMPVVNAYENEGFDFLLKAFEDTNYLEETTGLKKLHEEVNMDDVWALSETESE
ncbi:ubiquitin-like modifier-activating enzyme ATG7 [Leptotrombidium deliense]|uniref:Ubiquitin-like modifier-activating enzyme ATG7 n=1 Tax=Leptotrombidium deliense TaxID=299467 RepID=A0A443SMY4_9ACAR|nr:ubiquitin-like modifier-activating enzyme ATG7 [Leptotrombidium deliense]